MGKSSTEMVNDKLVLVKWIKKRPPYNVGEQCGLPPDTARNVVEVQKLAVYVDNKKAKKSVAAHEKKERARLLEEAKREESKKTDGEGYVDDSGEKEGNVWGEGDE